MVTLSALLPLLLYKMWRIGERRRPCAKHSAGMTAVKKTVSGNTGRFQTAKSCGGTYGKKGE